MAASRRLVLECDDGVRLLAFQARQHESGRRPAQRLAVLLHGWEGSSRLALRAVARAAPCSTGGYDVVRLNLRDHGDSHDLNAELFHSNRIAEVTSAVQRLQQPNPSAQVPHLAGFSLGGNFCLRVAARALRSGVDLGRARRQCGLPGARSCAARLAGLEHGWIVYRRYFVLEVAPFACAGSATCGRGWLRLRGHAAHDDPDRDDRTTSYGSTPTIRRSSTTCGVMQIVGDALRDLEVQSRVIAALDDPIIPAVATWTGCRRCLALEVTRARASAWALRLLRRPSGPGAGSSAEIAAEFRRGARNRPTRAAPAAAGLDDGWSGASARACG